MKLQNAATGSDVHIAATRQRRRGQVSVIGMGAVSTIKVVKTKLVSVFATRFSPDLDASTLSNYLKAKLNRDVTCLKIDNTRSWFSSFKVTAECNDITEMYSPELWPDGALVRRYYEPRKASTQRPIGVPPAMVLNGPVGVNPTV